MTLATYKKVRIALVMVLSMTVSAGISMRNFFIPVIAVIVSSLILFQVRKSVKEILADERDFAMGGKAALLAIRIYGFITIVPIFALYAFRDRNPSYEPIGMALAFSTCALMILYSAIFTYYNKISTTREKVLYVAFVALIFILLSVSTTRVFSGEDDWICESGKWVAHGHPSFPAPTVECK